MESDYLCDFNSKRERPDSAAARHPKSPYPHFNLQQAVNASNVPSAPTKEQYALSEDVENYCTPYFPHVKPITEPEYRKTEARSGPARLPFAIKQGHIQCTGPLSRVKCTTDLL